jgi:hypothetical protein
MSVARAPLSIAPWLARFPGGTAAGLASMVTLAAAGLPSPPPGPGSGIPAGAFHEVSALSSADAWAVGEVDTGGPAGLHTLAAHWNGSGWTRVATPSPGTGISGSTLDGVSAVSASDAWAVGYGNGSLILHWNGSRWTES